jgi:type II secretory pathway pseudopilin PulG
MSAANANPIARRADAGFSLAALIFFLTVASIFIAAAVPVYQMQAKREQEEELIFRGGEYTRAIQKYQRKFGAYPTSIDQLVSTNTLRFIRKPYKDPITGKDFRLILQAPNGALIGSKLYQQNVNSQPLFGNPQVLGGQNNPQQSQPGQPSQQPTQPLQQQQQPGQLPGGTFQGGINPQSQQPGQPGGMGFSQPSAQGGFGVSTIGGSSGTGQQISGGPIVGVATTSEAESIMIYNKRQKYDEWEFLAILGQQGQPGQPGQPGTANPPPQNPAQGQPGLQQNNPFQTPSAPSFGGPPRGSAFGPGAPQAPTQPPKLP